MTTPAKTEEIKTEPVSTKKAPVKRAAAKKTATSTTKKVEVKEAVYIQFAGAEYNLDEIRANVKKAWMDETGKKESDIKDIQIYVKPEEHAAYYVVNQEVVEGGRKIDL
ncbi:MAG: histone [Firmicutes bacterium]|nr:histone [Bacillota bacterium]